jgi:hypothetical protein
MLGMSIYVRTMSLVSEAGERLRNRNEDGQTAMEYVGLIFLAAIVMGALWSAFNALDLKTKIGTELAKLFS